MNFHIERQFDEPTLTLSREFLLRGINDSVVQAYYEYMVDIAVTFGADKERAKNELLDVLEFETSLANVCRAFFGVQQNLNSICSN